MTIMPQSELGHADPVPATNDGSLPAKDANLTSKSSSPFMFRRATTADAGEISSLVGTTWAEHFGWSIPPANLDEYLNISLAPAQFAKEIADEKFNFILALAQATSAGGDTEILGVAQLHAGPPEECLTLPKPIFLKRFYLKTSTHGTGLSSALLQSAEQVARELGYESIWLGVWENNGRAMRFYEKMGFERKGEQFFFAGGSKRKDWVLEKAL
ncbi:hypothetical protein IAT40_004955 [Kwoniella sp. CBS 6097]